MYAEGLRILWGVLGLMKQYFPDYMSYGLSYSTSSDGGGGAGKISPGDVTYSMVTIGNNTVLYV